MNYNENISRFEELLHEFSEMLATFEALSDPVDIEQDLWDNSDIIRNWNVSERTLDTWRKKKLISYIQVGSKIWYPKLAREEFLLNNLVDNDCPIDPIDDHFDIFLN